MRRIRKRILFILLALTMLGTILFFYINNIFIPIKFKQIAIERSEELLDRPVTIENIHYEFLKGFVLTGVRIFQKGNRFDSLISIEEASFNILLFNYVMSRAIIIPTMRFVRPSVHFRKISDHEWNFSDLIPQKRSGSSTKPPNVLLRKFVINDGSIFLSRHSTDHRPTVQFNNIDLLITLSIDKSIVFEGSAQTPIKNSLIKLDGNYGLFSKELNAQFMLKEFVLTDYLPFVNIPKSITLRQAHLSEADVHLNLINNVPTLTGAFSFDNLDLLNESAPGNTSLGTPIKALTHFSGSLEIQNSMLQFRDKSINFKGDILSHSTVRSGDKRLFKGKISSSIQKASFKEDDWQIIGSLQSHQTDIQIDKTHSLKGFIQASNISFQRKNTLIDIKGDYKLQHALIKTKGVDYIKGTASLLNTDLSNKDGQWIFNGGLETENTEVVIDGNKSFSGNIFSKSFSLKVSDGKIRYSSPLTIAGADLNYYHNIKGAGELSIDKFSLVLEDKILSIRSTLDVIDADLKIEKNITFTGHPHIDVHLTKNFINKKVNFNGFVEFNNGSLNGLPTIKSTDNLKGKLLFNPQALKTDDLGFDIDNTTFELKGALGNFQEPLADLNITSDSVDLEKLSPYLKTYLDKFGISLTGTGSLDATFKGLIKKPKKADIVIRSTLSHASLVTDKLKDKFSGINGDISYRTDHINWDNLEVNFRDTKYVLTGNVDNFSRPILKTTLKSDLLTYDTKVKILHGAFTIASSSGVIANSPFELAGEIHIKENAYPRLDMAGAINLDLKDLALLPEKFQKNIRKFEPKGNINLKGIYRGQFDQWRDWQLAFEGTSPSIQIKQHTFKDISIDYGQRDHYISDFSLLSTIYDGNLNINGAADLSKKDIPATFNINLENLQLASYRKHNKVKNNYLAGNLSIISEIKGPLLNTTDITGFGQAAITDGYLGRLIKEFKNAEFTNADADFVIKNRRIFTDNAKIYSKTINLRAQGWVDFDQNINFDIVPDFGRAGVIKVDNIRIDTTPLLANAISMKITGTLSNPVKKVNKSPTKIIGNTTEIIRQSIGSILQEVLP